MLCPRRDENPHVQSVRESDVYEDGTCKYCGSLLPDKFMALVENGVVVEPTDKSYKAYIDSHKFYYRHLSEEQMIRFVELYNNKTMKVGHPGYFYNPPFFMSFSRENA